MKRWYQTLVIVFALTGIMLFLNACDAEPRPRDPEVTVESIVPHYDAMPTTFNFEQFSLENVELIVHYSNGTQTIIQLTDALLDATDLEKLTVSGTHTITVTYYGKSVTFTLTLAEMMHYTITLDTAGGSPMAPLEVTESTPLMEPDTPSRLGHTFVGWMLDGLPAIFPITVEQDATLVAAWTRNYYSVTFDTAGGSEIAPISVAFDAQIGALETPIREGYTFIGWSPELPEKMPAEAFMVSAQWARNDYTLTLKDADGVVFDTRDLAYDADLSVLELTAPLKTGHTFTGWDPLLPTSMPAHHLVVQAVYTANTYTITFDTGLGSPISPLTDTYGMPITAPISPELSGYEFAGWYNDDAFSTPFEWLTMPAQDLTLYAKWVPVVIDEGLVYQINNDHVMITGYTGSASVLMIPEFIEGYPVTGIERYAFLMVDTLTSITIPKSVSYIGNMFVFARATALQEILVDPDNPHFTSVDGILFTKDLTVLWAYPIGRDHTTYTIPIGVEIIGHSAFQGAHYIQTIDLPETLEQIGQSAFMNMTNLQSLFIPASVTVIGSYAFYNAMNLETVIFENGSLVERIEAQTFAYAYKLRTIELPDGLTTIGNYAFQEAKLVTTLTIPSGVKTIGKDAFSHMDNLTSIWIPNTVTEIGERAFAEAPLLAQVIFEAGSQLTTLNRWTFSGAGQLTTIELPDSITVIDDFAFRNATGLVTIVLPENVQSIGAYAFKDALNLTSIFIPISVITIGEHAFNSIPNITLYLEANAIPLTWTQNWNAYQHPIILNAIKEDIPS